jgi:hypothetical protein
VNLEQVIRRIVSLEHKLQYLEEAEDEVLQYFAPALSQDIEAVKLRFELPEVYLEFLTRFSPHNHYGFSFGGL